jgi:threonine synthase
VTVDDEAIIEAWQALAREEGIFCEPASAASVAALSATRLEPGSRVVCVITGHGLKDPDTAVQRSPAPAEIDPDPDEIARAAG